MCPDPTVFSARASARVPSTSIVHENLYSRGQPRHQCLPFQVEACGRCQPVFGSHICSRANVVRLVRPQGPWQQLLASTLRPRFKELESCPKRRFLRSQLFDPALCSLSVLTIPSLLLLLVCAYTALFFFLASVAIGSAGRCYNLSGEIGSGSGACARCWETARGGWAVEVGPLRLLVVLPG